MPSECITGVRSSSSAVHLAAASEPREIVETRQATCAVDEHIGTPDSETARSNVGVRVAVRRWRRYGQHPEKARGSGAVGHPCAPPRPGRPEPSTFTWYLSSNRARR